MHCKISFKVRFNTRLASEQENQKMCDIIAQLERCVALNFHKDGDVLVLTSGGVEMFEAHSDFENELRFFKVFDGIVSDTIAYMCVCEENGIKMTHVRTSKVVFNVLGNIKTKKTKKRRAA